VAWVLTATGTALRALLAIGMPATACALLLAAVTAESRRLWQQRGMLAFEDLVLVCALGVLAAAAAWLTVAVGLTLTTALLRCTHTAAGRLAQRITPTVCRALLGGICGAAVLAAPAAALPASAGAAALPLPDRPVGVRTVPAVADADDSVRVRAGDTLWAIAARHLPATATDGRVARAWPVWFRHNRGPIGPDPHLIHPGTCLTVPPRFR
jgi:nucleoid-associated protein YgaU